MNLKTMMLSQSSQTHKKVHMYYSIYLKLKNRQYGDRRKIRVTMVGEVWGGGEINRGKV